MAEGLLEAYDEREQLRDERLGEKCFHILLNHSLFQEVRFDHPGNVVIKYKMHDVIHALAQSISKGETDEIIQYRCLRLQGGWSLKRGNESIASFDITQKEEFITKTKHLHALSLVKVGLEELPDWIGELKHLRYLDISRNRFRSLPAGLGKLYYLQTLIIASNVDPDREMQTSTIASTVDPSQGMVPSMPMFPKESRGMVPSVPMFPKEFTKLNNLRHLRTDIEMEIPHGIGMLTSLQTLPVINLDKHSWGGSAGELGKLQNLQGKLELRGFSDAGIIEELKKVKLGTKANIEELVLSFYSQLNQNQEDVNHLIMLEALEPHPNLVALEICSYQSRVLPNWMMEMTGCGGHPLDNLVSLYIRCCDVLEQLPSMKNLSALEVLKIAICCRATALRDVEGLTSLKCLDLFMCLEMQNLPDVWSSSCLEVVKIKQCSRLTRLPNGMANLPNLKTLEISELSPEVTIFPFPNLNHVSPLSTSLRELQMDAHTMDKVVDLPNQIQYLRQLRYLRIQSFKNLKELPEWLGNLASLETLVLRFLNLEYLPSEATMKRLTQLTTLRILNCYPLKNTCRPGGSEWIKIQHIPRVDVFDAA